MPIPGLVVRYFREKKVYDDPRTGKRKHWTQADVARRLGVEPLMVNRMETHNQGLDSMDRRQTLIALLNIPPVLLGLTSDECLQAMFHEQPASVSHAKVVATEEVQFYQQALGVYKTSYDQGSLLAMLPTIEMWIGRIEEHATSAHGKAQQSFFTLLWDYHTLAARSYMTDIQDGKKAKSHLHHALVLARALPNAELETMTHYRTGDFHIVVQRNPLLGREELDTALALSKRTDGATRGRVMSYTALAHAMTGSDGASVVYARNLLDEAEKYIDTSEIFNAAVYLEKKADIFIELKQWSNAHESIDMLEEYIQNMRRDLTYAHILRAECYIKQKKPDYDIAVMLLQDILEQNKQAPVNYHVRYVERLHKLLQQSPYGNSPDVADITMMLDAIKQG